jgi:hypothetical protein
MAYSCDFIYIAPQNSRVNWRKEAGKSGNAVWIFTKGLCNDVKNVKELLPIT